MKAVIIYKGKHGATQQYAQWLADDLQLPVFSEPDFNLSSLDSYDLVIVGGSVYAGRWTMHNWLAANASRLENKKLVFFIVCATPAHEIDTLKNIAQQNIPADLINKYPVFYLHGRLVQDKLTWSERLLLRIGAWLAKDPVKKREMTTDFDDVKRDHLAGILKAIRYEDKKIPVAI